MDVIPKIVESVMPLKSKNAKVAYEASGYISSAIMWFNNPLFPSREKAREKIERAIEKLNEVLG